MNMVFKLALGGAAAFSSMAWAGEAWVQDHYRDVVRQVPITQQVCNDVQVPVYSGRSEPRGDAMILGGIVGNVLGAASGLGGDARTIGTVIGGIAGAEMSRGNSVGGYRTEQRCSNVTHYSSQTEQVYSHSTVTFSHNGRSYSVNFRK